MQQDRMTFEELSSDEQVALAAYAVMLVSEPPSMSRRGQQRMRSELEGLPADLSRAFGQIFKLIGFRSRKQHNNMRRSDCGRPRTALNQKFTPVRNRRPAKRKVSA